MQVTVLGWRELDFKTEDGSHIKGKQLFVAFEEDSVEGYMTDKFFVKPEIQLPPNLKQGDTLTLNFNRKGKIQSVALVPQPKQG
ncbi:MAG: hypothetical protein FWB93_05195 [Oscillospiraceae bacterium]|nr:hypothetical protein [Oscillospiraceae bacterium]